MGHAASYLARAIAFVVVCAAVGALAAWALSSPGEEPYESRARALVGPLSTDVDAVRAAEQLTNTYKEAATSQLVVTEALERAGLDLDPRRVARGMDVVGDPGARLLSVRVRDLDRDRAATLADAILEALEILPVEGAGAVELLVIDPAEPGVLIGNQARALGAIGGVLGAALALILLLAVAPPPWSRRRQVTELEAFVPWGPKGPTVGEPVTTNGDVPQGVS